MDTNINIFKNAKWIADITQKWDKAESPIPTVFRKEFESNGQIKTAKLYCTAFGIYDLIFNGERVSKNYFSPGFTSYGHQLQYQVYDVTDLISGKNKIEITIAGGWAVGTFNYNRKNRIVTDFTSLLFELHIEYADNTKKVIGTDESWDVSYEGPVRFASWYDGEMYDATIVSDNINYHKAVVITPKANPKLLEQYGPPVNVWNELKPKSVKKSPDGELIYDFGQNFSGVISAEINGRKDQRITIRHSELLKDGELYTEPLRTAKQTIRYICKNGIQEYSPRFTYMGFRYIGVNGIEADNIKIKALALCSDIKEIGSFECSNEKLNRLNENIKWSARSNFIDIPTDCPQRDERLGWTGDISIFASAACYNYDMSNFLKKWLLDLRSEQGKFGGIPMVVPRNGHEWPPFTTACWGDCCILVPWAEYMARGDLELLRKSYPSMKKFLKSVKRWAGIFSVEKKKHIWKFLFQYGDWCAPQDPPEPWPKCVFTWMKKGKWIATAYYANSCNIVSQIADLLGEKEDAQYYSELRNEICRAYRDVFTDKKGTLKKEFQTGYVLPLYFNMTDDEESYKMASNLDRLVENAGNKLTTGFPSTPYLLFALADNGYSDRAYKLLLQEDCPSWLYEVKMGATTIWERWDAISPDGSMGQNAMCSCNHYAYGAVGDFLYRRVLGIEATSGGYKTFKIAPIIGGGLTFARGHHETPYGDITCGWYIKDNIFEINVTVPDETQCTLVMPSGRSKILAGGNYVFNENYKGE